VRVCLARVGGNQQRQQCQFESACCRLNFGFSSYAATSPAFIPLQNHQHCLYSLARKAANFEAKEDLVVLDL